MAQWWFAPSGPDAQRYLVKRQWVVEKNKVAHWRYHAVRTNDHRRRPQKLRQWALGRCAMQHLIKEHQRALGFEQLPAKKFHAKWAWLLMGQWAWHLVAWFKRLCLPERCHPMTRATVRHRLLNVAAKMVQQSGQVFWVLAEEKLFEQWSRLAREQVAALKAVSP